MGSVLMTSCALAMLLVSGPHCSVPSLRAGVIIITRSCGWIIVSPGIPGSGMVYCPVAGSITNYPTSLGCTGTKNYSAGWSSSVSNCPADGASNCGGDRGKTFSYSKEGIRVSSIGLFCIRTIALAISHTVSNNNPMSAQIFLMLCLVYLCSSLR